MLWLGALSTFKMWFYESFLKPWNHNCEKILKIHQETVNVPTGCSYNSWVIKVNEKPEITSVCSALYLCNRFQLGKLFPTYPMFNYSKYKIQNKILSQVSYVKSPSRFFIFVTRKLLNYSLQVFLVGFSSFLLFTNWRNPTVLVSKKSGSYSGLMDIKKKLLF